MRLLGKLCLEIVWLSTHSHTHNQSGVNETDAVTDSVWFGFAPIAVQNIYLLANIV